MIDLSGLSGPAEKLIESVSSAIGVVYEPTRIRRKAKAEADALAIRVKGKAKATEIEVRAAKRLEEKELRRQKNIEAITQQALEALPETVSEDPIDQDWIHQFYDHCEDIGNEQMQSLWAKLLAGEVAKPGSFSLRTMALVTTLSQADAERFTLLCTFSWIASGPLLLSQTKNWPEICEKVGIRLVDLVQLETLGAIKRDNDGFSLPVEGESNIGYHGREFSLEADGEKLWSIGEMVWTESGRELVPIAGGIPNEEYLTAVVENIRQQGFTMTEIEKSKMDD